MSIKIEIIAESGEQARQEMLDLLRGKPIQVHWASMGDSEEDDTVVSLERGREIVAGFEADAPETDADDKPKRKRRTKAEMEAAKAAEAAAATAAIERQAAAEQTDEPAAEVADENPPASDTPAAGAEAPSPATTDKSSATSAASDKWAGYDESKARNYIVANYITPFFADPDARKTAFRNLCAEFGVDAFRQIPSERYPEVLDRVERLIAERKG